ncbi:MULTISPECIES: PepSY domain-containing protein [unclassified Thermosynechococcus]|uniref:PepSY domain-containing protein n=1 Tax=unclassified Thermosynechococcus TaxID=2622553 RepID=UPI002671DA6A|nr:MULTISPECIES: PepSY domain-containing protein [unclassified Thermosynechococcus]WKT84291.1 PepSY domain-containing protein [Thermosynechococcus sp. HY596]WNC63425.1 PepSY domain-containing protein [Thermosynechococcus sp. HY591]WNC65986.1 PepSY domain-containing protein [Thermosynechococcus sp. HY593]
MKIRQLHRQVAIALWLPLGLTMWTGLAYRLGRSWLGLSKDFGKLMMTIHTGTFLGESFSLLYVLCLGLGVVVLTVSGFRLINPRRLKQYRRLAQPSSTLRLIHQYGATVVLLPLLVSAITGVAYHLSQQWLHLPKQQLAVLLQIHEGAYLGVAFKPLYILALSGVLLLMFLTGWKMRGKRFG